MVTIIWQFTNIWNDFLFGVVFTSGGQHPITVALNNLVNTSSTGVQHYNVDMAAAIITALPTFVVYIIAGRYFVRGNIGFNLNVARALFFDPQSEQRVA